MRGQSNVVGVALLLGVTVVALGTLTASVGVVVERNAASADAARVAADFEGALAPVETTGRNRGRVSFTDGRLRTVERELRVLNESGVVSEIQVDALTFTSGRHRVTFLSGTVVSGHDGTSRLHRPPPITASEDGDGGVLVVGAAVLNASEVAVSGIASDGVLLRTTVSHERTALGNDTYRVAIETRDSGVWSDYFRRQGATVEAADRDFDDDGVDSVVARFPGDRTGYVVVHDMRLEVDRG